MSGPKGEVKIAARFLSLKPRFSGIVVMSSIARQRSDDGVDDREIDWKSAGIVTIGDGPAVANIAL